MITAILRRPGLRLPSVDRRHWVPSLVLAVIFGLNLLAGLSLLAVGGPGDRAVAKVSSSLPAALHAQQAPPAPEPLQFREIAPEDAVAINAKVPVSTSPNPAARPFAFLPAGDLDRTKALDCLTAAVYYEAATEPRDGQQAVAQVVLNRVRHPAYPKSVCGVVFQGSERTTGCQFTFTCDGSLARAPHPAFWARARAVAQDALDGKVFKPVGWATHYHTNWVVPYWSSSLVKAAVVGTHIFYRWTGGWGTAPAFRNRHAGTEPDLGKMARLMGYPGVPVEGEALAAETLTPEQQAAVLAAAGTLPPAGPRAVIRRYEPAKREDLAALLATQAAKGETVSVSHRWALTGDAAGAKQAPLGRKAETAAEAAPAKPPPPRELQGVRKADEVYGPTVSP